MIEVFNIDNKLIGHISIYQEWPDYLGHTKRNYAWRTLTSDWKSEFFRGVAKKKAILEAKEKEKEKRELELLTVLKAKYKDYGTII